MSYGIQFWNTDGSVTLDGNKKTIPILDHFFVSSSGSRTYYTPYRVHVNNIVSGISEVQYSAPPKITITQISGGWTVSWQTQQYGTNACFITVYAY